MRHLALTGLVFALTMAAAAPANAQQTPIPGDYFVRPYATLGGSVIDGIEVNGATEKSIGFANVVTSSVDLDEGVARTYVNVTGPNVGGSATGSAAGVFGDTVTFYGDITAPVNVSFAFDGTILATARTNPNSLFQIGVFATLYVFDQSAGAAWNNFTSQPGALVAQTRSLDFSDPTDLLDITVDELLAGSFTPVSGRSYEIFSSLSVFSAVNDNASTAILDFRNTGRAGIDAPAGVTYASASGVFLDSVDAVAVPEPATWTMLIGGIGAAGGALRRRRTVAFA